MLQASGIMHNFAIGRRNFMFNGKSFFYDLNNNLFGEIIYCPDKESLFGKKKTLNNYFRGTIFRIKDKLKQKIIRKYQKAKLVKFKGIDIQKDIEE